MRSPRGEGHTVGGSRRRTIFGWISLENTKQHEKAQHDRNIKLQTFKVNDLVLLYDSKFDEFLGKLRMHWLGPYVIKGITNGGVVQLVKLNGKPFPIRVNGTHLKPYTGGSAI